MKSVIALPGALTLSKYHLFTVEHPTRAYNLLSSTHIEKHLNLTGLIYIQCYSPVDFRTLPVDCQNFLALTPLLCVVVTKKQCKQILATIHITLYAHLSTKCKLSE